MISFFPVTVKEVVLTPTLDTAVYAAGDALHDSFLTVGPLAPDARANELAKVIVVDKELKNLPLVLWFFNQTPTTTITKNAAFAPNDADILNLVAKVDIAAGTALSLNSIQSYLPSGQVDVIKPYQGRYVYLVISTGTGTPTWVATDAVQLRLYFRY